MSTFAKSCKGLDRAHLCTASLLGATFKSEEEKDSCTTKVESRASDKQKDGEDPTISQHFVASAVSLATNAERDKLEADMMVTGLDHIDDGASSNGVKQTKSEPAQAPQNGSFPKGPTI